MGLRISLKVVDGEIVATESIIGEMLAVSSISAVTM
jgi:hypothetical protein